MKVGKALGIPVDPFVYQASDEWVLPSQRIGVEIELENVRVGTIPNMFPAMWEVGQDHSLRNNGAEFSTTGHGLFGVDLANALRVFEVSHPPTWRISERTGLHVHIDVSDLETYPQLGTMCLNYALLEKLIFQWIGHGRDHNINCLPWYKAQGDLKTVSDIITKRSPTVSEFVRSVRSVQRYSALNLLSLSKFGTVEFRHMQATFDFAKIRIWINIIMQLKKSAMEWSGSHEAILEAVESDPMGYARHVLGHLLPTLSTTNMISSILDCLPVAYDLVSLYGQDTEERAEAAPVWEFNSTAKASILKADTPFSRFYNKHGGATAQALQAQSDPRRSVAYLMNMLLPPVDLEDVAVTDDEEPDVEEPENEDEGER